MRIPSLNLKSVQHLVYDLLFPRRCVVCQRRPESTDNFSGSICLICCNAMLACRSSLCPSCASPIPDLEIVRDGRCPCCWNHDFRMDGIAAVNQYHENPELKNMIMALKHQGQTHLARDLALLLSMAATSVFKPDSFDGLIPVPLHASRMIKRGYNQAELIARYLGKILNLPSLPWMLNRTKKTHPQQGGRVNRRINVADAFESPVQLSGGKFLLIDDVLTTGATVSECTRILVKSGAASVSIAVIAWVLPNYQLEVV